MEMHFRWKSSLSTSGGTQNRPTHQLSKMGYLSDHTVLQTSNPAAINNRFLKSMCLLSYSSKQGCGEYLANPYHLTGGLSHQYPVKEGYSLFTVGFGGGGLHVCQRSQY